VSENNKHKLKIVFFPNDCEMISGSSQCMYQLIIDLMKMDLVEPYIIFPCKGDAIQLCNDNNIPYEVVRSWGWCTPIKPQNYILQKVKDIAKFFLNFVAVFKIKNKLKYLKPDLIHNNTSYCYVGAFVAYLSRIPVVWQLHECQNEQDYKMWINRICCNVICMADSIVVISKDMYSVWRQRIGAANYTLIYDGLHVNGFYVDEREIFNSDNNKILCLGQITKKKGQDQTIKAMGRFRDSRLNLELDIVGAGADEDEFKKLSYTLGVNNRIAFHGNSLNPKEYYSKADIFVCNSWREAFGRVTVEAMLAGCLVIASDSGANPEILDNGKYGLMYRYGDIEDLAQKLEYAMTHKEEMREIAKAGQKYAVEYFDSMRNAKEFYEVYKECAK